MLRILGSRKTLCDGLSRRDFLHVGALGAFGLGLSDLFRAEHVQARPSSSGAFGKARACILLFPYGSPPQHETFDPKPEAPAEIQGEMKAIATRVPGLRIGDHLPRCAAVMDRVTVVRSLTHPYPLHGVAYAVSGLPTYTPALETRPRDPQHWPFIGSVVDYLGWTPSGTEGCTHAQLPLHDLRDTVRRERATARRLPHLRGRAAVPQGHGPAVDHPGAAAADQP